MSWLGGVGGAEIYNQISAWASNSRFTVQNTNHHTLERQV